MGAWGYGYCDNDTACDFLGELSLYEVDKTALSKLSILKIKKMINELADYINNAKDKDADDNAYYLRACIGWLSKHPRVSLSYMSFSDYKKTIRKGISRLRNEVLANKEFISSWKEPNNYRLQVYNDIRRAKAIYFKPKQEILKLRVS